MTTVYVYVLNTLADWETGLITAELNSKRFFKRDAQEIVLKTVSCTKEILTTMGGMKISPDCVIEDVIVSKDSVLLLPGADTWNNPEHRIIIEKAKELLSSGALVCAICGATTALASCGLLDNRAHTSNGPGFLDMMCPNYKGQSFYKDTPSVTDGNLITAACTGSLQWAKQIITYLDVFQTNTLESWYEYFSTGEAKHFFALMQSLPTGSGN